MTNINQFIFTRTQPQKKLEVIKSLTINEINMITTQTLIRMVREAGYSYKSRSRNKDLKISHKYRRGNNWNSTVDALCLYKGKLYLNLTILDDSTDHSTSIEFGKFFGDKYSGYRVSYIDTDRYGNPQTKYAVYDAKEKTAVLRSFLLEYVERKYADKLNPKS